MSAVLYDKAILDKIKSWVKDPNMKITGPNETRRLFEYIADTTNDKPIELPLIALRRDSTMNITVPRKRPLSYNGFRKDADFVNLYTKTKDIEIQKNKNYYIKIDEDEFKLVINPNQDNIKNYYELTDYQDREGKVSQLNAIPITLSYQLDIYTRYYEEAEEYVRNFIFNLVNFPKVTITIPYNESNICHNSHIDLYGDVQDNSDIPERLIAGQFTRKTIAFSVDGYLFDYRIKDAVKIENVLVDIKVELQSNKC